MSLRDWTGVVAGASAALLVSVVAYSRHPEHLIKILLFGSVVLLAILLLAQLIRAPWLAADIQALRRRSDGRLIVQLGLVVRGRGSLGPPDRQPHRPGGAPDRAVPP